MWGNYKRIDILLIVTSLQRLSHLLKKILIQYITIITTSHIIKFSYSLKNFLSEKEIKLFSTYLAEQT